MSARPHTASPEQALAGATPDSELFELLRAGLEQAIPFNVHNEVHVSEVAPGRGVAELPDAAHLQNHLGTQHGGALFAAGEAAAGAAYVGAFCDHLADIRMNAQEVHISYIRWAKGPITARSSLEQRPQEVLAQLHENGRVDLPMTCTLYDSSDRVVARMSFRFHLKYICHA